MNRRSFVLAMVGAPLSGAAATGVAEGPRVRIGFLGGSHSHGWDKIQITRQSGRYDLVGVWEEDPKVRARYEAAGVRALARDQLLNDPSIEVIAVESDVQDHAEHARLALEAGKHVHLEKPPADTMEKFRELVKTAERKQRLLQMGYMWRYNPAINAALPHFQQKRHTKMGI